MIIGLTGLKNSGKGTVANILAEEFGYLELSFAFKLKSVCAALFDWDRAMMEGFTEYSRNWREKPDAYWSEKLGRDFSPRNAMEEIGTDILRKHFHKDIWLFSLEKAILKYKDGLVISDVRFDNEVELLKKYGGKIWRIERDPLPDWWGKMHVPVNVHVSEWGMAHLPVDCVIKNNGNIRELEKQVLELVKHEK